MIVSQLLLLSIPGGGRFVFVHLIKTIQQLTRQAFQLILLLLIQRRPEKLQALMLRWQHLAQELIAFFRQMQMQTTTIVLAFATLDPATLLQLISNARGIGA